MIKRYDITINGIVEADAGNYVLYDDHEAVLESIGAGGISGRITGKTIEEYRAEFEEAVERHYSVHWHDREKTYMSEGGIQALIYQSKWQGWLAAKGIKE